MSDCNHCPFAEKNEYKIVLVGNPNVGKSSLFNLLSGRYEEVSNYPGTSVSVATAKTYGGTLTDTPGIYSLAGNSQLEKITKKYVAEADIIINVVNALTLDRDLILTKQLLEMKCNPMLVINQVDEAEKRGFSINQEKLSETLGIEVIKAIAIQGIGRHEILQAIQNHRKKTCCFADNYSNIKDIFDECLVKHHHGHRRRHGHHHRHRVKIDHFLLNPLFGWPIAIFVLYLLFKVLGTVISGYCVDYLIAAMDKFYVPMMSECVSNLFGNSLFAKILSGEFGMLTMTVKMIFGILLPLIAGFYILMSLLEDSGYIPRMAALTSRFFNFLGMNGDAVIPALLGFGCGAMGTISARILGTDKEKIIVTALIGIAIPCAAQQGIIISLLTSLNNADIFFAYIAVMLAITIISGKILNFCLKGDISCFVMDIPPLRLPSFNNCRRKTIRRVKDFLFESVPIFTASSVVISVLNEYGILNWLQSGLTPIVENLLHLPKEFSDVFVMGILRRDLASVEVFNMSRNLLETGSQILTATVVISLFVPCMNAILVIFKERGWKMAIGLWFGTFLISIGVGAVLTRIAEVVCG
ncbi:MAG: ferrous iron transporter B [Holosporaceae bacterium]|jgi:ferrous iron transport protein B|nr:ferrous iron transporter B [Holosporaceae bacterium]